jgi:hypothetical protein
MHLYDEGLHGDGINGIRYRSDNRTVMTSSRDPTASIIITHIGKPLMGQPNEIFKRFLQLNNSSEDLE